MFWAPQADTVHLWFLRLAKKGTSWNEDAELLEWGAALLLQDSAGRHRLLAASPRPLPLAKVYSAGQALAFLPCLGIWGWAVHWLKSEFPLSLALQGFLTVLKSWEERSCGTSLGTAMLYFMHVFKSRMSILPLFLHCPSKTGQSGQLITITWAHCVSSGQPGQTAVRKWFPPSQERPQNKSNSMVF